MSTSNKGKTPAVKGYNDAIAGVACRSVYYTTLQQREHYITGFTNGLKILKSSNWRRPKLIQGWLFDG